MPDERAAGLFRRFARAARRWLLRGPASRPTRRELALIAVMLIVYGSVVRVERSTWPVTTPSGPTLQEVLDRASHAAGAPTEQHDPVDISACSLEISATSSVVTFLEWRLGVYAWVEMSLLASPSDPLAGSPPSRGQSEAIERLFAEYIPCARTSVGTLTGGPHGLGQLRVSHGPAAPRRGGAVVLSRASGGDVWLGPWFTVLRAGFWLGWLVIAMLFWWFAVCKAEAAKQDVKRARLRAGLCPNCSYNLRAGGLTRCPECGAEAAAEQPPPIAGRPPK